MSKKNKIPIIITIAAFAIAVIVYFVYQVSSSFRQLHIVAKEFAKPINTLSATDSILFTNKSLEKMKAIAEFHSTKRLPIAHILYDSSYSIFRSEIPLSSDSGTLKNIIHLDQKELEPEFKNDINEKVWANFLEATFNVSNTQATSELYISLHGDSLSVIVQNDSVIYCRLLFHDLSAAYSKEGPFDMYIHMDKNKLNITRIPMNVLLFKRDKKLHVILMTPWDDGTPMPDSLLYNLIKLK